MKTKFYYSLFITCMSAAAFGQCTNAPYGIYPVDPVMPTVCNGVTQETIATNCYAGEYSKVILTGGNTYTFYSSNLTDYVTISDDAGSVAFTFGTTPVVYQPGTNQTVRFYLHTSSACGDENVSRSRIFSCANTAVVNELSAFELTVYPNPITTNVTISATKPIEAIQVISIDGKVLLKALPVSLSTTVSLEQFQSGTYFIQVTIDGIVQTKEVMKD